MNASKGESDIREESATVPSRVHSPDKDIHGSYPKAKPNYKGVGMRQLPRFDMAGLVAAHDDFLTELSKEFGRNFHYEFNEYYKNRLSPTTTNSTEGTE